jgi:hypothetical protein
VDGAASGEELVEGDADGGVVGAGEDWAVEGSGVLGDDPFAGVAVVLDVEAGVGVEGGDEGLGVGSGAAVGGLRAVRRRLLSIRDVLRK